MPLRPSRTRFQQHDHVVCSLPRVMTHTEEVEADAVVQPVIAPAAWQPVQVVSTCLSLWLSKQNVSFIAFVHFMYVYINSHKIFFHDFIFSNRVFAGTVYICVFNHNGNPLAAPTSADVPVPAHIGHIQDKCQILLRWASAARHSRRRHNGASAEQRARVEIWRTHRADWNGNKAQLQKSNSKWGMPCLREAMFALHLLL